jgi:hypothetical protein
MLTYGTKGMEGTERNREKGTHEMNRINRE